MASLPMLDTDWAKAAGRFGKMALKFLPVDFKGIKPEDFLKLELPQTLIFDDLERTRMEPKEILGAINGFVEHQGRNVILLANEEELWGTENQKEKEKVIGRTLTVIANVDAALDALFAKLGENVGGFLSDNRGIVVEIFEQADYHNLRTLEQALWEFERVYGVLEERFLEKTEGMETFLRLFLALTLEVKEGNFGKKDLKLRGGIDFDNKSEFKILREANAKYTSVEIQEGRYGSVMVHDIAISLIWDGAVDETAINTGLSQHHLFNNPEIESEWQTVWWVWHREPKDVETALKAMERKFKAHEYTEPAELLHVFSVWLNLAEIRLSEKTMKVLEAECEDYIKFVEGNNTLTARQVGHRGTHPYGYDEKGALGFRYPQHDDERTRAFRRLYEKTQEAQDRLFEAGFSGICDELLNLLPADPDMFNAQLASTGSDGKYAYHPVLKAIDAKVFVDQWLGLEIISVETVFQMFKDRYGKPGDELKSEQSWFRSVVRKLERRALDLSGVKKYQLEAKIKMYLHPILARWDKIK